MYLKCLLTTYTAHIGGQWRQPHEITTRFGSIFFEKAGSRRGTLYRSMTTEAPSSTGRKES